MHRSTTLLLQAFALSLSATVSLGFARFNYALLLPAMRESLAWDYSQAGGMNTVNALGYLLGALIATSLAKRFGLHLVFKLAFIISALSLLGTGLSDDFGVLLFLRFIVGLSGAILFILGASLASQLARKGRAGLIFGIYVGGVGIGIFLAGMVLPKMVASSPELWRESWMLMGGLSLLAAWLAVSVANAVKLSNESDNTSLNWVFPYQLLPSLFAYFLFGLGYITYMTFIIAHIRGSDIGVDQIGIFWMILGASAFVSAFVWSRVMDQASNRKGLGMVMLVVTLGSVLPVISLTPFSLYVSAVLFGVSFLSVVAMSMNIARRSFPAPAWTASIALYTIFFSLGQTIGPLMSGILADKSNSLQGGFLLSSSFLALGVVLALFQKTCFYSLEKD